MAIDPENEFPGKIDPADADYPDGKARNVTTPLDGTGTPWTANLLNDIWGLLQKLTDAAGIAPNGNPDTVQVSQYFQSLQALFAELTGAAFTGPLSIAAGANPVDLQFGDPSTNIAQLLMGPGGAALSNVVGSSFSGGDLFFAYNASQPTHNTNAWRQHDVTLPSMLLFMDGSANTVEVYTAVAGKANGTFAAFWGTADRIITEGANPSIAGDGIDGRVKRTMEIVFQDGTAGTTIKSFSTDRFAGDVVPTTDNIAKNVTTGDFSLDATGHILKLLASALSGNLVEVTDASLIFNSFGAPYYVAMKENTGDIEITITNVSGATQDITTLVNSGAVRILLTYVTDA